MDVAALVRLIGGTGTLLCLAVFVAWVIYERFGRSRDHVAPPRLTWNVHTPAGVVTVKATTFEIDEETGALMLFDWDDEQTACFPREQWISVWFGDVEFRRADNVAEEPVAPVV